MAEVGLIGLGAMGSAIGRRLVVSDHAVHVCDLREDAVADLVNLGAHAADPQGIARRCSIVITCLPRSEDVYDLVSGTTAMGSAMRSGSVLVDMTSGSPVLDRELVGDLVDRGVGFADAPVSGGPQAADAGTLSIMVGASSEVFVLIGPVLRAVSPNVRHVGPVGAGHTIKLVNNYLSALNRLAAFEAMDLAVRNDVDLRTCIEVINSSSGRSYITESTFPKFLMDGEPTHQGFKLSLMLKDITLAAEIGAASGARMTLGEHAIGEYVRGVQEYGQACDINELARNYAFGAAATANGPG